MSCTAGSRIDTLHGRGHPPGNRFFIEVDPDATQFTLHLGSAFFGVWRQSRDRRQSIFAIHNVTDRHQTLSLAELNLILTDPWSDLLDGRIVDELTGELALEPYEAAWITNRSVQDRSGQDRPR